jgi:hypothetical protein
VHSWKVKKSDTKHWIKVLRNRLFFPAIYLVFLLPVVTSLSAGVKLAVLGLCIFLAFTINYRPILRIFALFLTGLCTLIPFLFLVQSAVCSSFVYSDLMSFVLCMTQKSIAVLLNVSLMSSVSLLAIANEWRGSMLMTINGMCLPRNIRTIAVIVGAMIGEFKRAMIRVHQAFTARGEALPSMSVRNLIVLPTMFGAVWASVLSGVVKRFQGQWSSEEFWARYVPVRPHDHTRVTLSDITVLIAGGLVISVLATLFIV